MEEGSAKLVCTATFPSLISNMTDAPHSRFQIVNVQKVKSAMDLASKRVKLLTPKRKTWRLMPIRNKERDQSCPGS